MRSKDDSSIPQRRMHTYPRQSYDSHGYDAAKGYGSATKARPASARMAASYDASAPYSDQQYRYYTTAGPVAMSGARRREMELRKMLSVSLMIALPSVTQSFGDLCNSPFFFLTQEEVVKEAQRQAVLSKGGMDERERVRILRIFTVEREQVGSVMWCPVLICCLRGNAHTY